MKKKILSIALVVAMVAIIAVGSIAYFTDKDSAKNTFTVGNVGIDLTEKEWDANLAENGTPVLMPGQTIAKDPLVTVDDNSEDCWLFVKIEWSRYVAYIDLAINLRIIDSAADLANNAKREAFFDAFVEGFDHNDWEVMNAAEIASVLTTHAAGDAWPATLDIILGYKGGANDGILSAKDTVAIFTGLKLPEGTNQTNAHLFYEYADGTPKDSQNVDINITAYAIQAAGLDTLADAYVQVNFAA